MDHILLYGEEGLPHFLNSSPHLEAASEVVVKLAHDGY